MVQILIHWIRVNTAINGFVCKFKFIRKEKIEINKINNAEILPSFKRYVTCDLSKNINKITDKIKNIGIVICPKKIFAPKILAAKRGKKESEKISNMRDAAFVFLKRKKTAKKPPIKKPRIENPGRRKMWIKRKGAIKENWELSKINKSLPIINDTKSAINI